MKTFIALLSTIFVLVVPAQAYSRTVFVGKVPSVWRTPNGAAFLEFRHNPDSNRVWVSATLCDKYVTGDWAASDCKLYNQHKIRVAGLVYIVRQAPFALAATSAHGWKMDRGRRSIGRQATASSTSTLFAPITTMGLRGTGARWM
ncbi:hypothetical protein I6F35_03100 [Bradyrhizobium sp. BRP22]|uniref:hypothetical protein n=1 Tax=Bradyrhizobium sp. BRP22 TaxID=2793821 RepID=UPI001CD53A6C|nr:hypothetical protein [Bradyrhizobium sp. BRP22]MCA1452203.1 hypothetical protein [Bradyrhizobium sp. BRP22]